MIPVYTFYILSINEKLPPLKFQYFGIHKNSFKTFSFIDDSGKRQIDLVTLNSSTSPGIMGHVVHVQFVIFDFFEN